jgi:hypothetical protein
MSWNESKILKARQAILDAAQDMLAGRLTYIEGARKIVAAWWRSKLDEGTPISCPSSALLLKLKLCRLAR